MVHPAFCGVAEAAQGAASCQFRAQWRPHRTPVWLKSRGVAKPSPTVSATTTAVLPVRRLGLCRPYQAETDRAVAGLLFVYAAVTTLLCHL